MSTMRLFNMVFLMFLLALMSKPQVITFPFLLLLWDYWPLRRLEASAGVHWLRPAIRALVEKLPLLAIAGMSSATARSTSML